MAEGAGEPEADGAKAFGDMVEVSAGDLIEMTTGERIRLRLQAIPRGNRGPRYPSAVFSAMALAGLLTLGVGLVLFVVGWAALFEHGRRLRRRTAEELALEPAPPADLAGLLLLINLPAALVCLSIAVSQAAANPAFC